MRIARWQGNFAALCVVIVALEAFVVLTLRDDTFAIEGRKQYDIAGQKVVSHAFLMRGDGLQAISVRLSSRTAATARLRWTLWRGSADFPPMTRAAEGEERPVLRPGRQWTTLHVTRDGSSHNRWYTIELQPLDVDAGPDAGGRGEEPSVVLVASHDNPDRGGVLWVAGERQPGSLYLRAHRRGKTLHGRFLAEAAPSLPRVFRQPSAQWLVVVMFHWALITFAYALLSDARRASAMRDKL